MISPVTKQGRPLLRRRRVLFAIRDPAMPKQPALAKAIQIARALDASLELFHALTGPVFIDSAGLADASADTARERLESDARIHLLRHCAVAR